MQMTLLNQRYRFDQELGHGSMGTVYRGYDLLLERDVLVKVLNPTSLDTESRQRLLSEARAVAKLDHPNIISVYDAGEADGTPFIVMQAFLGQSLHEVGSLPIPQVIEIAIQVCRALEHAHHQGIIHRDVKPENIILVKSGDRWTARLTDFGLARSMASRLTSEGVISGTVFYMAPEQALGKTLDGRADLYALGVILYECVAGKLPFEANDPLAVISQHLHAPVVPPSTYSEQISPALGALILRLLSKQPDERPSSAAETRLALERILQPAANEKPRHNLPVQLTSFIGREKESVEVLRLFKQTRLLTLSGVGGAGKTRLALHCAGRVVGEFEHGIWLVELARLTDPERILPAVAAVFGYYEGQEEGMPLKARLLHHLQDKPLLLILDNCEHLITAAAELVDSILRAAPEVKVLATSREALGLEGETIYLTPALSLPDPDHLPVLDQLPQFDAVRLFVERAHAALPAFSLTKANASDIAQICQRLDGIPLAIELAAARVKALSTDQILARLSDRFRLLTGGSRTALPRQRTLQATIDWSYGLLTDAEQALLRSLSVFMGGFSLDAAEGVCACSGELEVLDGLALLVSKSLVEAEVVEGEVRRYHLLETVRQYAQEKLDEQGEAAQVRDRHLAYFLEVSKQVEKYMMFLTGMKFVQSLKVEISNFRAAYNWAFGSDDSFIVSQGLLLASNLFYYYLNLNLYSEGVSWLKKGLVLLDGNNDQYIPIRAKALLWAGWLSSVLDSNIDSAIMLKQSINLFRKCAQPDISYLANALAEFSIMGYWFPNQSREAFEVESQALRHEASSLFVKSGTRWDLLWNAFTKMYAAIRSKDFEKVYGLIDDARIICQGSEFDGWEFVFLADFAAEQGDLSKALDYCRIGLEKTRLFGFQYPTIWLLLSGGNCAKELNLMDQAHGFYHEAMAITRETGSKWMFTSALKNLAEICLSQGQYQQAGKYLEQGLILAPEMDPDNLIAECLFPLLAAAKGMSPPEKLARLLGYMSQVLDEHNITFVYLKPRYEQVVADLQARLDPETFQSSLAAGWNMTIEQVQAEARIIARELASYQPV